MEEQEASCLCFLQNGNGNDDDADGERGDENGDDEQSGGSWSLGRGEQSVPGQQMPLQLSLSLTFSSHGLTVAAARKKHFQVPDSGCQRIQGRLWSLRKVSDRGGVGLDCGAHLLVSNPDWTPATELLG